jgi:hypothetical protein
MKKLLLISLVTALFACGGGESSGGSNEIKSSYSSNDCLFNTLDDEIFYDAFVQFGRLYKIGFEINFDDDTASLKLEEVLDAVGPFKSSIAFNKDGIDFIDDSGNELQRLSYQELEFSNQCEELLTRGRKQSRTFFNVNKADFIPVEVSSGVFVGPNASYYPLERKTELFRRAVFTRDGVLYSHKDYMTAGILTDGSAKLVIASSLGVTVLDLQ